MNYRQKAELFLQRFKARTDVYGMKWVSNKQKKADGTPIVGYAPQCENFWEDVCHIKTKSGTPCSNCEHQQFKPVTVETALKHIKGQEQHLYYLVDPSANTVNFAAMDFDKKPGKEEKGYDFVDVERCARVLEAYGVPHAIARSTTALHHALSQSRQSHGSKSCVIASCCSQSLVAGTSMNFCT